MNELLSIKSLTALRDAEQKCTRCPLYKDATQVVPGEGPARARIMLVGEQPGDQEDKQGKPFVGPAGGVLVRLLKTPRLIASWFCHQRGETLQIRAAWQTAAAQAP